MSVSDQESVPSLGNHPWRWQSGFFLRRSGRGRVSSQKLGDLCASAPSLQADPMPLRMTQQSCRPRVSDRTMVGNSATRLACEFQRTERRRHDEHETPTGRGRNMQAPSLRGLRGRSATGLNGQAAKEEVSALWRGGWMPENISGVPAGRSVFHLTSPLIGPPLIGLLARTRGRTKSPPSWTLVGARSKQSLSLI